MAARTRSVTVRTELCALRLPCACIGAAFLVTMPRSSDVLISAGDGRLARSGGSITRISDASEQAARSWPLSRAWRRRRCPCPEKAAATVCQVVAVVPRFAVGPGMKEPKHLAELLETDFIASLERFKAFLCSLVFNAGNSLARWANHRHVRPKHGRRRSRGHYLHFGLHRGPGPVLLRPFANHLDRCAVMGQVVVPAKQAGPRRGQEAASVSKVHDAHRTLAI